MCIWFQRKIEFTNHSVEKSSKTRSLFYGNINIFSVKSTFLLDKEVTQNLVSRKFFKRDHVLLYFSTCICAHQIDLTFDFTKNRKIIWRTDRLLFHGKNYVLCANCENNRNFLLPKKYFVKSTTYLVISLVKMLLSRNLCQKRVRVNFRNFYTVLQQHVASCMQVDFTKKICKFQKR